MMTNRVSAILSAADQEAVMTAIATIRQKLPFLIDLTTPERVAITKLGDKSQAFTRKAFEIAAQNMGLLSQEFVEEMRKDAQLLDSFAPVRLAIDQLQKQVDDTALQLGAEAFAGARTIYAITKTPFAQASLRIASDDLGKRFGRRSRKAPASVEPAPPSPPPPSPASNA